MSPLEDTPPLPSRKPAETHNVMTELVLPNDTNTLGNLMGGRLLHWMDIAAAISAMKHCNGPVVTASVDNVSFANPIKLGYIVILESKVTRAFHTSMEIYVRVWAENMTTQRRYLSNEAYLTFVSLDELGKPIKTRELVPETDEEKEMYEGALHRRQLRLVLGGKLSLKEAPELQELFAKQ